jgi:FKBP-type peptidyl-prolyl cis-trans isomerase FklB
MKNTLSSSLLVLLVSLFSSGLQASEAALSGSADEVPPANADALKKDLSYFFGFSFGNMLKEGGNVEVDMPRLNQGMLDSLAGKAPAMDEAQQQAVIGAIRAQQEAAQALRAEAQASMASQAAKESAAFLQENAAKAGVKTTASGLQYEELVAGTGESPTPENTVKVHYEGRLVNGQVFDSSIARDMPAEFGLSQVIAGWTEGLQLMKAGGKTRFTIPSDLAYGPGGMGGIPPNSVLIFDVELLEVK